MGETHRLVSPARVFARPTADEIWLGPSQQAALSQLSRPAPIRVIVGPPSSGKTTLAQALRDAAPRELRRAALSRPEGRRGRRAREPAVERGPCALGSVGDRATQSAHGLHAATALAESAGLLLIDDAHISSPRRWRKSSGSCCSRSTRSLRSSWCWPVRHRSRSTGEPRAARLELGELARARRSRPPSRTICRLPRLAARPLRDAGSHDTDGDPNDRALERRALCRGRRAVPDVAVAAAAVEPGASGRARGAASGRNARGAPRRQARNRPTPRAPSRGSTRRRRGISLISRGGKIARAQSRSDSERSRPQRAQRRLPAEPVPRAATTPSSSARRKATTSWI